MAKYNFDEKINRYNTNSLKWDYAKYRNKPEDILPLWVADMDFKCPDEVINELVLKSNHGIFGYSEPLEDYFEILNSWFLKHYNYSVSKDNIVLSPGVVFALSNAVCALTKKGDAIIINEPVYYPFSEVILDNERKLIVSELVNNKNKYEFDYTDFEEKIVANDVKLYIISNPHNPVGKVWKESELKRIYDICKKHNVFILSDEIHADFIFKGNKFTSLATISKTKDDIIVFTSPSKTFNVAGLHNANIYIPNLDIKNLYLKEQNKRGYSQSNIMGIVAAMACYKYGELWLEELLEYLESNLDFLRNYLKEKLSQIKLIEPEGTYLIWLDFKNFNLPRKKLEDIIVNKAKLWLDPGIVFGKSGDKFERINIATQRSVLLDALNRLYNAFKEEGLLDGSN